MSDGGSDSRIDELLDQAFEEISRGQRTAASILAEQVLAIDRGNADAEDLLSAPASEGEIRRLTIMFADLVDSTELSTRTEPEVYRGVVGRYKNLVREIVDRYEGQIASTKGDGLLVMFGHPTAHENDVVRAVQAGLDITREVDKLSEKTQQRFGFGINVRVGVHRGVVYLDLEQDDVYGLAANLTARISGLAPPGAVVVSTAVEALTRASFDFEQLEAKPVKGVPGLVDHFLVLGERSDETVMPSGPLIGRERESTHLEQAWRQAQEVGHRPIGVAFHGEAGIGKSRMAAAAATLAEQSGAAVLTLRGSPLHVDVGLHPVRRLLERQCGIDRSTPPESRLALLTEELSARGLDPTTAVPLLAPVLAVAPKAGYRPVGTDGTVLLSQIFETVHQYLRACCGDGPALVVAEDMHWFDEDTVAVVDRLLRDDDRRLLVVMTSREVRSIPNVRGVEHIALSPLSERESDELIMALHPDLDPLARSTIRRQCDGVPLFIEEVVAKLREEHGPSGPVPDSLYEALITRLRSSRDTIRVAEAAAIIGTRVDRQTLQAVAQVDASQLDRAIRDLRAARVLLPATADSWQFRHELLREVATELSPPSVLRQLHGRVADVLLSLTADTNTDWPLIASHYEQAHQHESAASAYQKASGVARRRGALLEAIGYLSGAVEQIQQLPPDPDRDRREISIRLRRGFLYYAAEGTVSVRAAADFERCLQLRANDVGDDLLAILTALYGHYAVRADLDRTEQVVRAIEASVVRGDPDNWPTVTAGYGMVDWYRGHFDSARELLERAASLRHNVGGTLITHWFMANDPVASIHSHLALARYIQGDLAGAMAELEASERRCEDIGIPQGPFSRGYGRQMEVLIRIDAGDLDGAARVCTEMESDACTHNMDSWVAVSRAQAAVVAGLRAAEEPGAEGSALAGHIATIAAIVDEWRETGLRSLITFYDALLARLLLTAGRDQEARDRVDIGLRLAAETGMHCYDAELYRIRAHTLDDTARCSEGLREAIDLAHRQNALIFELRCATDDFELRGEPSRQQLLDVVGRFPPGSSWPALARASRLLG